MRKMILSLAVLAMSFPAFAADKVKVGDKAPVFSGIPAINAKGEATTLNLGDIKKDVVVVTFLANHCPAVVAYEDRIIDLVNKNKDKSVELIAICCTDPESSYGKQDDIKMIAAKIKEKGYNFAYGFDGEGTSGKAYGAIATPHFFVLNKDRELVYAGALDNNNNESAADKNYVQAAIDAALKGESPETKETRARGCGIAYKSR
ncbi:MAG: redoxin family protein [Planctomycetota bacterium]|nr:redoxin domain-containing protein [Planctomycetota bacterium]